MEPNPWRNACLQLGDHAAALSHIGVLSLAGLRSRAIKKLVVIGMENELPLAAQPLPVAWTLRVWAPGATPLAFQETE